MYILAYLVFLASLVFVMLSIYRLGSSRESEMLRRLKQLNAKGAGLDALPGGVKGQKLGPFADFLAKNIKLFEQIGVEITAKEIIVLDVISYLLVFLIVFLLDKNLLSGLIVGLAGLFIPYLVVSYLVRQRAKAFEKLFSDALYLMANILKSGFSLRQALQVIAEEMPEPLCNEFELLNQEINWGLSLNEAMVNLNKRIPNEYVSLFVTAIVIQSEVGGSLSDIVGKIAEAIRTREEIRGELNVLTAQGKVSGFIVSLMPFAIGSFVFVVNPAYIKQLFTTPIGLLLVGGALVLEIFGIFVIKAIVNVE